MLATVVLVGSVGSPSTYGHAHEGGEKDHQHHGWDSGHDVHHDEDAHDQGAEWPSFSPNEFHLHSILFGIPYTLPGSGAGLEECDAKPFLLSDACPSLSSTLAASRFAPLKERIPWSCSGVLLALAADAALRPVAYPSHHLCSQPPWCSPHARSVVLRC